MGGGYILENACKSMHTSLSIEHNQHYKHMVSKAINLLHWKLVLCNQKIYKSSIMVDMHCSFIDVGRLSRTRNTCYIEFFEEPPRIDQEFNINVQHPQLQQSQNIQSSSKHLTPLLASSMRCCLHARSHHTTYSRCN